jgi:Tripartite tricarboxylate transporter TctB family
MSRRLQENIVILLLLAFFVAILVVSLGYGPRTRLVPVPISILAIVLILFQLVWQNLRTADDLSIDLLAVLTGRGDAPDAKGADAAPQQTGAGPSAEWQRIAIAFGMIALFMAMILAVGPIPSIFLFTAAYFVLSGHYRLGKATFYAALFTIATYLVFVQILRVQLYNGYLEPVAEFLRRLGNGG